MDLIPDNVAPIAPMIRGNQYMDRLERHEDLDIDFIKYIILIAKTSDDMNIGVSGNADEMAAQLKQTLQEIEDYNTRAKKLTLEDYPELWI